MKRALFAVFTMGMLISTQSQAVLVNSDFETGTLEGWTVFTTANGTLGADYPAVTYFDTNNDGVDSLAATFNVGQLSIGGAPGGGGISQSVMMGAGSYSLSADIAMVDVGGSSNADGGLFELLFDGTVVDSWDFGAATLNVPEYQMLSSFDVTTAGMHEVAIRMTRNYLSDVSVTPFQYIDNVNLISASVPEPSTVALLGLGLLGFSLSRRLKA